MESSQQINKAELKTAVYLSAIYASRMLGLFLIFPTFSLLATGLENTTPLKIGLALGIYSLAQATLQIPAGILSDMIGRKKVIYLGLILFLLGSLLATSTNDINVLIWARLLQGSGAVSAVCLAYIADNIRDSQHSKVMAIIGMSIASSFIFSFILGSVISRYYGLQGLFASTAIFSVIALLFAYLLPKSSQQLSNFKLIEFVEVIKSKRLMRINLQIALLHMTLSASFFLIPILVSQHFDETINYASFYLPAILIAFALVMPLMRKRDKSEQILSIKWGVLALALFLLAMPISYQSKIAFISVITLFFFAFIYIEAMLPSRLFAATTNATCRGATSGIYSVYQFSGNFLGGILGANLYSFFVLGDIIHRSFYILSFISCCIFIASFLFKKVSHGE